MVLMSDEYKTTWLIECEVCGLLYREDEEAETCPHKPVQ